MLAQAIDNASDITREELEALTKVREGYCVSLYLPTHRTGREVRQDPIRLKNRISEAEEKLAAIGAEPDGVQRLLEEVRSLCNFDSDENQEFWAHQGAGIAVLIGDGETRLLRLRVETPEATFVGHRFHVRPLIAAAQRDGEYALVAASRGELRFFEGDRSGLVEVELADAPDSLRAVAEKAHHKGFNLHSFHVRSGDGDSAVPHGHVDTSEDEPLRRYFSEIAEAIEDAEQHAERVVVFAGVPELFAYFKEAADGRRFEFLAEPVEGAPDHLPTDELHEKAWPLVERRIAERTDQRVERWRAASHTDLVGEGFEEVLNAASDGRVDMLLVAAGAHQDGAYDADKRSVDLRVDASEAVDLVELAAAKTLATGGSVYVVDKQRIDYPSTGLAALYRYTVG